MLLVDGDIRLTCRELHRPRRARWRSALLPRMPAGSVVSFMLPNWHEAAVVYLAATLAGMVVNPILPSLRDHELTFILADADSRMLFIPAQFRGHDYAGDAGPGGRRTADRRPRSWWCAGPRGRTPTTAPCSTRAAAAELPTLDPDAVRMILYTSGTTGRPKGVLHSHNSIHALISQLGQHWLIDPGDTFLVPSPIAHIGGSIYAFECPLLLGTTAVLMDTLGPRCRGRADARRTLHPHGRRDAVPGRSCSPPPQRAGTRLPDLKVFICGGRPSRRR